MVRCLVRETEGPTILSHFGRGINRISAVARKRGARLATIPHTADATRSGELQHPVWYGEGLLWMDYCKSTILRLFWKPGARRR
jgi:hypothetical protein